VTNSSGKPDGQSRGFPWVFPCERRAMVARERYRVVTGLLPLGPSIGFVMKAVSFQRDSRSGFARSTREEAA
jgi:hypothetical protein